MTASSASAGPAHPAPGPAPRAPLAYYYGDDELTIERAVARFDRAVAGDGEPLERWDLRGARADAANLIAEIHGRVATAAMFGGGTLAVVANPAALAVRNEDRDALLELLTLVAPGNALAFTEAAASGAKEPGQKALAAAVAAAGGEVKRFDSPREGALAAWIESEARDRDVRLVVGVAKELAGRIGGFVREGDVERQQQGRIAVMELEKLALRHAADEPVTVDDVQALVAEAVPGSMWAFVDAVGMRQRARSLELLERLLDDKPAPVLLAVLHRRIRDLIEIQDRLHRGETPGSLVRSMRLQPFRAETLARQAQAWTARDLDGALDGLIELDAQVKGVGGRSSGEARDRLAFDLWITDLVAPA